MYAVLIENQIFIHLKYNFYTKISVRSGYVVKGNQPNVRMTFQDITYIARLQKEKKETI